MFVLGSYRFDTQGMVLAEAAATGTPILYCDERLTVGVSAANALRCDPGAESMAGAMRELMDSPDRLERMAAASRSIGRGLTAEAMRDNYLSVYLSAIATRSSGPS